MTSIVLPIIPLASIEYTSPFGILTIITDSEAVYAVHFGRVPINVHNGNAAPYPLTHKTCNQLQEYFSGKRRTFSLPLRPQGTSFQQKVWQALQDIPYGETRSYKDIAAMIGNVHAARAVGGANNKNPIAIIIPCHRVIGSNGMLVGYAAGISYKKKLLNHEQQHSCQYQLFK